MARAAELDATGYSRYLRTVYVITATNKANGQVHESYGRGYLDEIQARGAFAYDNMNTYRIVKNVIPRRFVAQLSERRPDDPLSLTATGESAREGLETLWKQFGPRLANVEEVDLRAVLPRFISRPQEYIRTTPPEYEFTFVGREDRRYLKAANTAEAKAEIQRRLPRWEVATVAPVTRPPLYYKVLVASDGEAPDVTQERAYSVTEARALVERRFPARRVLAVWEATMGEGTSAYQAWQKRMEDWGVRVDAEGTDKQPTCFDAPSSDVLVPMWTPPPPVPGCKRVYRLEYVGEGAQENGGKREVLLCEMPCLEDAVRWYWKVSEPGRKGLRLCDVSFDHREPDAPASLNLGAPDFPVNGG